MTTEKKGLFERSRQNQATIQQHAEKLFDRLGITGEPIPAEQLQAMMEAQGMRPEDNELSRGIIEMRADTRG